jgi:hypothetical protein
MALFGLVRADNLADVTDRERTWDNIGVNIESELDLNNLYNAIGFPMAGGYFAGYISHTANGVPTHALIVAPRATGATGSWLHADHRPPVEDHQHYYRRHGQFL